MRILSGAARSRRLKNLPRGWEVRPIFARMRKSLFDILRPRLVDKTFLDLFAGIGTVGLEALSNGAKHAVFIDKDRTSLKNIEANVRDLGFGGQTEIYYGDVTRDLSFLANRQFDFIFLGPPYRDDKKQPLALSVPSLKKILEAGLALPHSWVINQHHKKEDVSGALSEWNEFRRNVYGDSVLSFFQRRVS